jgi:hypothetical protein
MSLILGAFGMNGIGVEMGHRADFVKEFRLLIFSDIRHIRPLSSCGDGADNRCRAKRPENPAKMALSGQNNKLING